MIEKIKHNTVIKYIIVFSITLIFGLYFSLTPAKARIIKEGPNTDAILSNKSAEERQLWDKLQLMKSVGGNKINVPALMATILYGSSSLDVASAEYEKDYDPNVYTSFFKDIVSDTNTKFSEGENMQGGVKPIEANQISKLTAAFFLMYDSSIKNGRYTDESYQKALESDKLFGHFLDDESDSYEKTCFESKAFDLGCLLNDVIRKSKSSVAYGYNALLCGMGALADAGGTALEIPGSSILWGNTIGQTIDRKFNRWATMANVCHYGYLEGVNANIRNITDDEKKAAKKKEYAEGIITLAKIYRYYYEDEDKCLYDSGTSGDSDAANWRQCDSKWGSQSLGGSSNMCQIGCAVTSLSYIIKSSGTSLSVDNFDPGVFVEKASFTNGNIYWQSSISAVSPKGHMDKQDQPISYSNAASVVKNLLETDTNGHKTFVQLYITNHYIAVDHVDGDTIYVMDPAASKSGLTTLDDALNRGGTQRSLISYNTFYFDDVNSGGTTNSSNTSTSYNSDTYQKRLQNVSSLVDQKKGSVWNTDKKYNSEDTIKSKMESGSAVAALAGAYYLYTGKTPDGYEFYKAAVDDNVKTDNSNSMQPLIDGNAKTLEEKFGLTGKKLSSYTVDEIVKELKSGNKIIAGVRDSSFGQDHFVLLDHYNESNDQIYVYNPNKENQKEGYFSKDIILSDIVNKVAFDLTVIYSKDTNLDTNYCDVSGDGDIDQFISLLEQLEGGCDECTVRGKSGCKSYRDTADQTDVGNTTAWGITQRNSVGPGLAREVGYDNWDTDMSNGCVDKEFLTKMLQNEIEKDTNIVKTIYEEAYPGKSLKTCQYHAFVLFYHHWPAMAPEFIKTVGGMDFMSYEAYKYYLDHNGAHGMQGLLNRREAEYHLLNTCRYDITKVADASYDKSYWESRIKLYKEELGQS